MFKPLTFFILLIFTSCSKKEVKYTILKEHKETTYLHLKERIAKEEIIDIANGFISKKENKEKISICFLLTKKKHEAPFAIVYFQNLSCPEIAIHKFHRYGKPSRNSLCKAHSERLHNVF
jgi:hypothetical protein